MRSHEQSTKRFWPSMIIQWARRMTITCYFTPRCLPKCGMTWKSDVHSSFNYAAFLNLLNRDPLAVFSLEMPRDKGSLLTNKLGRPRGRFGDGERSRRHHVKNLPKHSLSICPGIGKSDKAKGVPPGGKPFQEYPLLEQDDHLAEESVQHDERA